MEDEFGSLVVVELLFRSKGAFTDLPYVINLVSLFLDSSVELPLHKACQRGSLELLERVWSASEKFVNNFDYNEAWTLRKYIRTDRHYRQFQFTKSMTEAARLKSVEMVTWLAERFQGFTVKESVVTEAARVGSIDILRLLRAYDNSSADPSIRDAGDGLKVEWTGQHVLAAAQNGHGRVIWWLQFKCGFTAVPARTAALDAAINNGDIVLAEWLLGHSTVWAQHDGDLHPVHHAAANGDLDVLEWIFKSTNFVAYVGLVVVAAAGGHLHVIRWLISPARGVAGYVPYDPRPGYVSYYAQPHRSYVKLTRLGGEARVADFSRVKIGFIESNSIIGIFLK